MYQTFFFVGFRVDIFSERLSDNVSPVARNRTVVALVAEQVTRNLAQR